MKKLYIFILLLSLFFGLFAQNKQNSSKPNVDKYSITLRPNSREYAPVRRTNMHQRMELRRTRTMIQNRNHPQYNKQFKNKTKIGVAPNNIRSHQRMIRNRQEMIKRQQQRMLRRKIIMQQRRRMRR